MRTMQQSGGKLKRKKFAFDSNRKKKETTEVHLMTFRWPNCLGHFLRLIYSSAVTTTSLKTRDNTAHYNNR